MSFKQLELRMSIVTKMYSCHFVKFVLEKYNFGYFTEKRNFTRLNRKQTTKSTSILAKTPY